MHIHELLPVGARPAIEKALAQPLSYSARYLVTPGARPRALVILGEAHVKLGAAAALGKGVVTRFELRGVETFQIKQVLLGRLLGILVNGPRLLLRAVTLNAVKGSTITDAKAIDTGHTVELEKNDAIPVALHVTSVYLCALFSVFYATLALTLLGIVVPPLVTIALVFQVHLLALVPAYLLRRERWAWFIHPAVALVTVRDTLMAEGTVRMFAEHEGAPAAVVVMGRAHVSGYAQELIDKHGFLPAEL